MSTQWLSNYFDFDSMGPADMVLSRHVEILRADADLVELMGGEEERILYCPLGTNLSLIVAPALFATHGVDTRVPSPGAFADSCIVRDVIRFEQWKPTDTAAPWTPGIASLVSKIRTIVTDNPHLNYTPDGWVGAPIPLTRHVNTRDVSYEAVLNPDGEIETTWDLIIEFEYELDTNRDGRIRSLAINSL